MSSFSDEIADLDDAVEEELLDPAEYYPDGVTGAFVPVMIALDHPRPEDRVGGMAFTRQRPVMRLRRIRAPKLREKALFRVNGKYWVAAEAPQATDDGAWWLFEVQPG